MVKHTNKNSSNKSHNKSSNRGKKVKHNNIGNMFTKRQNNNTWILLGLVVIVGLVVYYYYFTNSKEETFENTTTNTENQSTETTESEDTIINAENHSTENHSTENQDMENTTTNNNETTEPQEMEVPELSTETQEMYQRVRDELAQLYSSANGELSDTLKESLKSLSPSQRKSICQTYCTSFTPCTDLCKLTECTNCTGEAVGDMDMSGMGLPGTSLSYAGIDDQYLLLDNVDDNTSGLNVDANLQNLGNKNMMGPHIVQKDTNGISNIFAPYIIMTPKRKNETYGTYILDDPNDPFQKRFIESIMANY